MLRSLYSVALLVAVVAPHQAWVFSGIASPLSIHRHKPQQHQCSSWPRRSFGVVKKPELWRVNSVPTTTLHAAADDEEDDFEDDWEYEEYEEEEEEIDDDSEEEEEEWEYEYEYIDDQKERKYIYNPDGGFDEDFFDDEATKVPIQVDSEDPEHAELIKSVLETAERREDKGGREHFDPVDFMKNEMSEEEAEILDGIRGLR